MFVGHYGVSFAAKKVDRTIPLWVLFLATQFLDVLWAPCILLGIEKVRIAPGITASNPLDLYYMPYTHSLAAAILWSCAAAVAYWFVLRPTRRLTSAVIGFAVFSHWILDFVVHRPDLPLYDNSAKVGLGLWNSPALAFGLEAALLFGGIWLCLRGRLAHSLGTLGFGVLMLATQAYVFFGPPPTSDRAAAWTALIAYSVFAAVIWWLQDRREGTGAEKYEGRPAQRGSGTNRAQRPWTGSAWRISKHRGDRPLSRGATTILAAEPPHSNPSRRVRDTHVEPVHSALVRRQRNISPHERYVAII